MGLKKIIGVHHVNRSTSLTFGRSERSVADYGLAKTALAPGGLLLNADLAVPAGQVDPERPGRLSVARHLALLRALGYTGVACSLETGEFGCVTARNSEF